MLELTDSHCHLDMLDLANFDDSMQNVLANARDNHVQHCLCVAVNLRDLPNMLRIANQFDNVSASVGVHPNEQDDDHDITKKLIESFKSMSTIRALKLLQNLNIAVLEIQDINTLRKKWERSKEQSILKTQHVEGLGKVSTIVSNQVKVNDQKLHSLTPSEKVGGSTQILLKQFGIDADNLIAERIAATELSSSYLP